MAPEWTVKPAGRTHCLHCRSYWIFRYGLFTYSTFQRLTVPIVDTFIADLKDSIAEAKASPSGKGTMVAIYGNSFREIFLFS
jgi:hypothetical protein